MVEDDEPPYYQLCNNYQLGNFWILPVHDGINPKRAQPPYLDYADKLFNVLVDYFLGELAPTDVLTKAISAQHEYFDQFEDWADFFPRTFWERFGILMKRGHRLT